jgi:tetratricopeptide (TPR) repeat protein
LTKARFSRIFLILLSAGWLFSCKSAPKPVEEPPPEPEQAAGETVEAVEDTDSVIVTPDTEEPDNAELLAEMEKRRQAHSELGDILTQARAKRQEIMNDNLYETFEERFLDADAALTRATGAYDAGFEALPETALEDGRTAFSEFSAIIDEWWLAKAEEAYKKSAGLQQEALKLKADVAAKASYNLAAELHNKAGAALRSQNYRSAIEFYTDAVPAFSEAIGISTEKKARAEAALATAERKISESEKLADDAVNLLENYTEDTGGNYDL